MIFIFILDNLYCDFYSESAQIWQGSAKYCVDSSWCNNALVKSLWNSLHHIIIHVDCGYTWILQKTWKLEGCEPSNLNNRAKLSGHKKASQLEENVWVLSCLRLQMLSCSSNTVEIVDMTVKKNGKHDHLLDK